MPFAPALHEHYYNNGGIMDREIKESDLVVIEQRKPAYPVDPLLADYLKTYDRDQGFPLTYRELRDFDQQIPLYDGAGTDTLWQTVLYDPGQREELHDKLCRIYVLLKIEGNESFLKSLSVDRIDYCEFGNSQPFRIRIRNRYNDNHDYYYVKKTDASRIYGLELEHILAPNRINFLVYGDTLVEEHIAGIPGDVFIQEYLTGDAAPQDFNPTRLSKEFVKFNERCFAKLLGDMRSYNYVMILTRDFDSTQYRVRAIDFDRQSHEGALKVYLPQFYKENQPVVSMVWKHLPPETIRQYQSEERVLMRRRAVLARARLSDLFECMSKDRICVPEALASLRTELARYHKDPSFALIENMGTLTQAHLEATLAKD